MDAKSRHSAEVDVDVQVYRPRIRLFSNMKRITCLRLFFLRLLIISYRKVFKNTGSQCARLLLIHMSIGIVCTIAAKIIDRAETDIDIVMTENLLRKREVDLLESYR